jgi:secondary thiamine-phosphate synthase enzyme
MRTTAACRSSGRRAVSPPPGGKPVLSEHAVIELETRGETDILDITDAVAARCREAGLREGLAVVFIGGATGGLTTLEVEPGAVEDLRDCFERLAPEDLPYRHDAAYHDGNGHSHVRAALLGPSVSIPVAGGALTLGTWQRIVFIDFDNRPRRREVQVQCLGLS